MRLIVSKFLGVIEGVEIRSQALYNAMDYILDQIDEKFGRCYNSCFVRDLKESIEYVYKKYDQFDFSQLEAEFDVNVEKFEDIKFTYNFSSYGFRELNKEIKAGNKYPNKYLKLKGEAI